jgi:dienelactone hydrolase
MGEELLMKIASLLSLIIVAATASATIVTKKVAYEQGGVALEGYLAYDDAIKTKKPGVLIIHDWDGLTGYEESRAKQLAELGYVAFAADIYGRDSRPKTMQENGQAAGKYKNDPNLFHLRLKAGLDKLRSLTEVNKQKIAAIGYCFGGTGVLEMARAGMDLKGIVSFHGGLSTKDPAKPKSIKSQMLIAHALRDPAQEPGAWDTFLAEMKQGGANPETITFDIATHAFTVPGPMYDANADKQSWAAMQAFLSKLFR